MQKSKNDFEETHRGLLPAFLRDIRIIQTIAQVIFVILVVLVANQIVGDTVSALEAQGNAPELGFLSNRASFALADAGGYTADDSYWAAFQVGVVNTLRVVSVGLIATTILGILFGIFLLSNNYLVRTLARTYVELLRNTPVLLQIIAWLFIVIFALPPLDQAIQIPAEGRQVLPVGDYILYGLFLFSVWRWSRNVSGDIRWKPLIMPGAILVVLALEIIGFSTGVTMRVDVFPSIILSVQGVVTGTILPTDRFALWSLFIVIGVTLAIIMWVYFGRVTEETGRPINRGGYALAAILMFTLIGWVLVGIERPPESYVNASGETVRFQEAYDSNTLPLDVHLRSSRQPILYVRPELNERGSSVVEGITISRNYLAVFLGLVVYTSAFIAEIVRAGIQAVPGGQIEAARALGLSSTQMLRLIILPQALRVIIPPMTNQYLNFSKNSSLAIAVAYTDIFQVMNTVINQSGQSVTGIIIIMVSYLVISLVISVVMNWVNSRFQLVTR